MIIQPTHTTKYTHLYLLQCFCSTIAASVNSFNFFALPVLELLVLLLVIVPSFWMLKRETQIRNFGIAMLMAVIINALLQIVDRIRVDETCNGLDFYTFEKYCELIIMQSFCNIPFVLIGLAVLLIWWPRD